MDVGMLSVPVLRGAGDTRPLQALYAAAVERAVRAEQSGYDFFQVGEHHFMENQWNPSPLMVLAGIATRTTRLRLGTNVLLAPMYHPVRLAEDVATLDLLSNGRLDLVCGTGSVRGEFETLGIDADERVGRMWEVMDILRRSYAEPDLDYTGRYYQYPNIRMTTRPVQHPFPLWYGGRGPLNARRAGREGYHAFLHGGTSPEPYLEGLREAGRDPAAYNVGLCFISIVVVERQSDVDAARARLATAGAAQAQEYARTRDLSRTPAASRAREPLYNEGRAGIGTPDQVLRQLEPQFKDSVYTHLCPGGEGGRADLFIKEVMPVLKTWGRTPVQAGAHPTDTIAAPLETTA